MSESSLRFDRTRYLTLFEAFDQVGRFMYQDDWTGLEGFSKRVTDPAETVEERNSLVSSMQVIAQKMETQAEFVGMDYPEDVQQSASDRLHILRMESEAIRKKLSYVPNVSDSTIADFEMYQRRRTVEERLKKAFEAKELEIYAGASWIVDWNAWCHKKGFGISFSLSMVLLPPDVSSRRRTPAFLDKKEFLNWIAPFKASGKEREVQDEVDQATEWLKVQFTRGSKDDRKKADYLNHAHQLFPQISKRKMQGIWANVAPSDLMKAGRRKN